MRGGSFPGREAEDRGLKARSFAALLLALLAPALGGGTSQGAVAVLLAGVGLVAVALPARRVRVGFLVAAGLVLVAALGWAWPARLVELPWRERLEAAGFPLAWCCSPEPWVSLRAWLLLLGGLVWAGWCAGQGWTSRSRRVVCEGLAAGIGVIALIALAARGRHVPGWPEGTGLGPFENRNQTAALFAMGAFLTVVCGAERARKPGRSGWMAAWWLLWLGLLGMYTAALAINRSRSGPLLFAGMTLAWVLTVTPPWRRKPEALAVGVAVGLLLGTIFVLTGDRVIARLEGTQMMDFRLKIFRDTFWMIREADWTGTGLGCFDAVFPMYRQASILQQRVLHPESDWLWLAAETGLPGLLAMAGLAGWMGTRVWEGMQRRQDGAMQLALCVACAGVLAHSLVDVPGHRLGTVMPALLLLGLAVGAGEEKRWAEWMLRGAGLVVLALGAASLGVLAFGIPVPVVNGVELLTDRALREEAAGGIGQGEATLGRALAWEPLDWRLYVIRARMEGGHGELTAALGDFRRARFLEPNYSGLPFDEGIYWLNVAPSFAIEPWEDALRRSAREERPEWYQNMLSHAYPGHPEMHADLGALAGADHAMRLVYFGWATPSEFEIGIQEMLHENPVLNGFTPAELKRLFPLWMSKGDAGQLASLMERRTEWLKAGYRALAEYDASRGDLADAVDVMERYLPPPAMPPESPSPMMRHAEAAKRFEEDHGDLAAGMALYYEEMKAGREEEALETLRRLDTSNPAACPGYVHYLEGQLAGKQQKWGEAWKALAQCPD